MIKEISSSDAKVGNLAFYLNKPDEKSIDLGPYPGYAKYHEIGLPVEVTDYMDKLVEQVPLRVHFVDAQMDGIGHDFDYGEKAFGEIRGWVRPVQVSDKDAPFIMEHTIWGLRADPTTIYLRVRVKFPAWFEKPWFNRSE